MTFCRSPFVFIHIVGSTFIFNIFMDGVIPGVGCLGWKTVKRATALRQNFIDLLAYIYEPYSSSGSAESLPLRLCGVFRDSSHGHHPGALTRNGCLSNKEPQSLNCTNSALFASGNP